MYEYKAEILSVYDGDGSYKAIVDLGMNIKIKKDLRLLGVDTPEMRSVQAKAGKVVRDFVRDLILDKTVVVKTEKDESGKYGRLLVSITLEDGQDLATLLLVKAYAKPFTGKVKKEPWTKEELKAITREV